MHRLLQIRHFRSGANCWCVDGENFGEVKRCEMVEYFEVIDKIKSESAKFEKIKVEYYASLSEYDMEAVEGVRLAKFRLTFSVMSIW
jgi:hypothetical protein